MSEEVVEDVPGSSWFRRKRNRYGRVPGLPEDELADPDELERQVHLEEWGPVLRLPVKQRGSGFSPAVDESGGIDWGAFGTVDFERTYGGLDKVHYKIDCLREELGDVLILVGIVKERMPGNAKYLVLKYLRMGVIELDHVVDDDMLVLARLESRARRIQKQIAELEESREQRRRRAVEAWLEV